MNTLTPKTETSTVHSCATMLCLGEHFPTIQYSYTGCYKNPTPLEFNQEDTMTQFRMCGVEFNEFIHFMTTKTLHLNSL